MAAISCKGPIIINKRTGQEKDMKIEENYDHILYVPLLVFSWLWNTPCLSWFFDAIEKCLDKYSLTESLVETNRDITNDQASDMIGLIKSNFTTYFTVPSEFNFTYQIPDVIACVLIYICREDWKRKRNINCSIIVLIGCKYFQQYEKYFWTG